MERHYSSRFSAGPVDTGSGVIKGVSVITEGVEAQGHGVFIDRTTLEQMMDCAKAYSNGVKVVDRHTRGTDSVFSTVGTLRNFRIEGQQLKADLYLLKSEPNTAKLMEMAAEIPDTFGLSVAFSGPDEIIEGKPYQRCTEIYNVALVDVPAANPSGLFSAKPVDASRDNKMTPEEFSAYKTQCEERMGKFEAAIQEIKAALPKDNKSELSAIETKLNELSAKVKESGDVAELGRSIAKEFAKHTGQSPVVAAAPAANAGPAEKSPADKYEEAVQKHFAATKSKVEAVKLAIKECPDGYKAFMGVGKTIKFA